MTCRTPLLGSAIILPTIFSFALGLISMTSAHGQVRRERPSSQIGKSTESSTNSETLVAERAIESLKQSGTYDSLVEAVKRAGGPKSGSDSNDLFNGGQYEEKSLVASDGNPDEAIGYTVAISGNTAVVGSGFFGKGPGNGAAYVFVRNGNDWIQQAKLTAPDGALGDGFGTAVAISGDSIAVGAPYTDSYPDWNDGSVYVFIRSGDTWTQQSKLVSADTTPYDFFGLALSFSGDTLLVGAPYKDAPPTCDSRDGAVCLGGPPDYDYGAAYVFVRSGTVWSQQQKLLQPDGAPFDVFGRAVAVSGDTLAVGAPYDDEGTFEDRGTVFVYTRSGTTWTAQQTISASDGIQYDYFGWSIGLDGDSLIAGSPCSDVGGYGCGGAAFLFSRSGATWSQTQKLTAATPQEGGYYGFSVSIQGNNAVVGNPGDSVGGFGYERGSVEAWNLVGATWKRQYRFVAGDGVGGDVFGYSTAIDGDSVIVGVPGDVTAPCLSCAGGIPYATGSARVFQTKVDIDKQSTSDGTTSDWFGRSVAISGNTAVVGAPLDDIGAKVNRGSAYIFVRIGAAWTEQAKLVSSDGEAGDNFGWSVSIDGDRVIVGAPLDDVGANADQGSAYVFVRSVGVWSEQQKLNSYYTGAGNNFGWSVAISGGRAIVGEPLYDNGVTDSGTTTEFVQSGSTWSPHWLVRTVVTNAKFGWSVSVSGDTAVVGAPGYDAEKGQAFTLKMFPSTIQIASLAQGDGAAGDKFGWSVSISGDTAVVGAPWNDTGEPICPTASLGCSGASVAPEAVPPTNQGAAYVFTGSGTAWALQQKVTAADGDNNDQFGYSVSNYANNLFVGAYGDDVGGIADRGAAYLYKRVGTFWTQQRKFSDATGGIGDAFGWSVGVSSSTAVVGAWSDDVSAPTYGQNQGSATFYNWTPMVPTAAGAKLSGKVLTEDGRAIKNATVVLTDSGGKELTVQTGTFGNFSFENLPSGETFIIGVRSGRFAFAPQIVSLQEDVGELTIKALAPAARR